MSEQTRTQKTTIRVNSSAQRRLESGHQWVFSNEVLDKLPEYESGQLVTIANNNGRAIAEGYVNPHTLIAVRALAGPNVPIDERFFRERIIGADMWRRALYPEQQTYRVIHGEADGLSGLVVDRYADHLSVQVLTAGMEQLQPIWLPILEEHFTPRAIIARNDTAFRQYENLSEAVTVLSGSPADTVEVEEHGVRFLVDIRGGQKTGLFLDQKDNRRALSSFAKDATVLDTFCYVGGWGLAAAKAGAASVVGVDSSESALAAARENARVNGVDDRCSFERADVFDALREFSAEGREFDIVVVDPPAFAKRRSQIPQAKKGYRDVNIQALKLVKPGGILATCTCSHHISSDQFRNLVVQAGRAAGRTLRLIEARGAAADHPVLLSMRETEYLTCLLLQAM
jgi:23S rRNA (cytosine1962-C5)-methyltransferase